MTSGDSTTNTSFRQAGASRDASQTGIPGKPSELVKGVLILGFAPESEAEKAGLRKGDVILQYDEIGELSTKKIAGLTTATCPQKSMVPVLFVREGRKRSLALSTGSLGIQAMDTRTQVSARRNQEADRRDDEPLFVLRYRPYKMVLRIVWYSILILIFGAGVFLVPAKHPLSLEVLLATIMYVFLSVAGMLQVFHILSFKEVRLYRDRMVKIFRWSKRNEVMLECASLYGGKFIFHSFKTIANQDAKVLQRVINGVIYNEYLADRESINELNNLLADISGRNVLEFEGFSTSIPGLIKKGEK